MQPNDLHLKENTFTVKPGQELQVNLGKLPVEKYRYRISINNSSGLPGILRIYASNKVSKFNEQTVSFKDISSVHEYNFDTKDAFDLCYINFKLESDEIIYLHLPISATIRQTIEGASPFLFGLDEDILSRISESETQPLQNASSLRNSEGSFNQRSRSSMNTKEIESFINARYFQGFLSVEESERQLDYVIYHKMFNPAGTSGLAKYKRKILRRMGVGIYRLLTRNRSRKLYFAKLYRNYINSGILSDNYHH